LSIEEIKMEDQLSEFECNDCLSDKAYFDQFSGITFAYAMSTTTREKTLCHYVLTPVISSSSKDEPRDTRAYREMSRCYGKQVPPVKADALRDELFVVPGAAMSAADVVKALRDFIAEIEKHGMFIGKYRDTYVKEGISGERRFEER
jgi:hypothetical protein